MKSILLKCGEKNISDLTVDELESVIDIYADNEIIGDICICPCDDCLGLELISIKEEHRGNGYGTEAMNILIDVCKKLNISYIHGDSPNIRKPFYTRLGAIYECRDEYDETFINDRFYIDINN